MTLSASQPADATRRCVRRTTMTDAPPPHVGRFHRKHFQTLDFWLALVLLGSTAEGSNSTQCSQEPGQCIKCAQAGHPGGRCQIIKTVTGGDPDDCCTSCSLYPGCEFWVYNTEFASCYLKSGDSSHKEAGRCTSGKVTSPPSPAPVPPKKACIGSRTPGTRITCQAPGHSGGNCEIVQALPETSVDECCGWCAGNPQCEFWVLDHIDKKCFLKRGDTSHVVANPSYDSGVLASHGGWAPTFTSAAELNSSPWAKYLLSLYGDLTPIQYPIVLSRFWCFYMDKLAAHSVNLPPSVGRCPTSAAAPEGQRYDENNAYSSKDLTWLWHDLAAAPFQGYPSNSIVEVSHLKDPYGDEHHGMWFLYAKGSGVYVQLGKTKVFNDHGDAYAFFKAQGNEAMCQAAASQGFDSVQFVQHHDGANYPCAAQIGVPYMNMEIVMVTMVGSYPCGQAAGTAPGLRAGWQGTKPCKCDPNNPNTNCVFS